MKEGVVLQRRILSDLNYWYLTKGRKPLILRGARQVGKSTAVRMFAASQKRHLYEINLERHPRLDPVFATLDIPLIRRELEGICRQRIDPHEGILFLDEVQATPHALAALRYFYEDWPELAVVTAGSLLEFVLSEHEFSMPVGRVQYGYMQPMSFEEFLLAKEEHWLCEQLRTYELGHPWAATTHQSLLSHLRDFYFVGGMPAVVAAQGHGSDAKAAAQVQEDVVASYRDDFAKYEKKALLPLLQSIYDRLPSQAGTKLKYSRLAPDERAERVRSCVDHLSQARIVRQVFHSQADGIPLGAQAKERILKTYWLDIGLLNHMLGVWRPLLTPDAAFFHAGALAEQFIAQHLAALGGSSHPGRLYYWLREGKQGNSEVDFVCQFGAEIVPVEVKSGATGSMKSLLQFVAARKVPRAVKFSIGPPAIEASRHQVVTPSGSAAVSFDLVHLPLYFVEQLDRLLN